MTQGRGLIIAISASLITGCAIGLIAGVLFARAVLFPHPFERRVPGPPGPREMSQFVEQRLGLSTGQSVRFQAILEHARSRADSLHEATRGEILAILTPAQRERWERMSHQMFPDERRRRGPHGRRGAGMPYGDPDDVPSEPAPGDRP